MSEPRRGLAPHAVMAALSASHESIRRRSEESCFVPKPGRWSSRLAMCLRALCLRIGRGVRTRFLSLFPGQGGTQ